MSLIYNNNLLLMFTILFSIFLLSPIFTQDADALPDNVPLDNASQELCYDEDRLNDIEVDNSTGQINLIRQLTGTTLQEISSQTRMSITATDACQLTDPVRNAISTKDLGADFRDGVVNGFPDDINPEFKTVFYNDRSGHDGYSSITDCDPYTEIPNFRYISNHEFGHFAGLDHVPVEPPGVYTNLMSRQCNTSYETFLEDHLETITSMYPIPYWHKEPAQLWSDNPVTSMIEFQANYY